MKRHNPSCNCIECRPAAPTQASACPECGLVSDRTVSRHMLNCTLNPLNEDDGPRYDHMSTRLKPVPCPKCGQNYSNWSGCACTYKPALCANCGGIAGTTHDCTPWKPAPPDSFDSDAGRTYDFEPAPTTAYRHVPLTTGASLEPERPNFSGWTEEKPSESAERENQAQRYAHEMDCSTEPLLDFKAGWDAAISWLRKNGGGNGQG